MAIGDLAPPPLRSRLVDQAGLMTRDFNNWLRGLTSAINTASTSSVSPIVLTAQPDLILPSVALPSAPAGTYRISYAVRIRRPAGLSSSVQVQLGWTSGTILQTFTGPALTGNATTATQSNAVLAQVDGGSPITYSTAYASTGAPSMTYDLTIAVEAISG